MRKPLHNLSRLLLTIVLLINGTVTATAWAAGAPVAAVEQSSHGHEHCPDAMPDAPQSHDGCCAPGTCHCAYSSLPGIVDLIPVRAPLLRVGSMAPFDYEALPTPALTRHFRPPIRRISVSD